MTIHGIGIDIVEIDRIKRILVHHPLRFPQRVLHPRELAAYENRRDHAAFLSRHFAAKEAVSKALGCGFTRGLYPCRILVRRNEAGRPLVVLPDKGPLAAQLAQFEVMVSIADERHYVVAQATAIQRVPGTAVAL